MKLPEIISFGIFDSDKYKLNTQISKSRKVSVFEIELPLEEGGISYIDSSSERISQDTLICAKPGQVRYTRFPFKCLYIHMGVEEGVLCDILKKTPNYIKTANAEKYKEIFLRMLNYSNIFSQEDNIMLQSLVLELIYVLNSEIGKQYINGKSSANSLVIEETLKYIDEHLTDDLSLEKLAELNRLSPVHFHNIFKKTMEKTLRKYVEEKRIKKSISLILTTDMTLTEIAFLCGFSSQSYFSYAFKRKMGCTPREYMKKSNEKYEV